MSAPDDAYVLQEGCDGPTNMKPFTIPVVCESCGWKGTWGALLGSDDQETIWCPMCRVAAWVWK